MSPKRFSQHVANLFPVPARAALVALAIFIGLAVLASLVLLGPGPAPVTAAPAVTDPALDLSGSPPVLRLTTLLTPTTTALTASPGSPIVYGNTATFQATVTGSGGTPGGSVTFKDGATTLATKTLSGGQASLDVQLSGGTHTITAQYGGGGGFAASNSGPLSYQVLKAELTSFSLDCNPDDPVYGEEVTCTADVFPDDATGVVYFDDNGTEIGRDVLGTWGQATVTTFSLAAGKHVIKAVYHGDENYKAAESDNTEELTVAKADTEIDPFESSDDDSVYGQYVTFTATVSHEHAGDPNWPGATTPTGLVTFWSWDGTYLLPMGQGVLNGEGVAWFGTSDLAVDDYTIIAFYEGDTNYNPDDEYLNQKVNKADTEVTVSGPGSSYYGKSVTFEAKVSVVPPGAGDPTGKVEFTGWGDPFEATLFDGKASFITMEPHNVGSVTITAVYCKDNDCEGWLALL